MSERTVLAEGKTKIIYSVPHEVFPDAHADLFSKDVVTWNNQFSAPMPGKGAWSTRTTVAMFHILRNCQDVRVRIPYPELIDAQTFRTNRCEMIPIEVVVRDVVDEKSSYLKRHPETEAGVRFPEPRVEFFLKSHGKHFAGIELPDDDPFISKIAPEGVWVHHPGLPIEGEGVFIPCEALGCQNWPPYLDAVFDTMGSAAQQAFICLRDAWKMLGFDLRDFKIEFGRDSHFFLTMADVLDNDSWRIRGPDGREYSKQNVRDGKNLEEAAKDYALIADKSEELLELVRKRVFS